MTDANESKQPLVTFQQIEPSDPFSPLSFTWLPTRSCALHCPSCRIPLQAGRNLPQDQVYKIMDRVLLLYPNLSLWVILGGDVLDMEDPVSFVRELSRRNAPYAITSHSQFSSPKQLDSLVQAGLKNWSVSIDHPSFEKTRSGFKAIDMLAQRGVYGVHATLTIDKTTAPYIPGLVYLLDTLGAWSEITPFIWRKGPEYDFGSSVKLRAPRSLFDATIRHCLHLQSNGARIHNTKAYLQYLLQDYEQEWRCNYPWSLVIDNDGKYRLCLHVRGTEISKYSIFDSVSQEALRHAWNKDRDKYCRGCSWNCTWEAAYVLSTSGSREAVTSYFNHQLDN